MQLSFAQGVVQASANFVTISGQYASLNAQTKPVLATACNRIKNYLIVEHTNVSTAWGPIVRRDQWLFWDINTFDGSKTYGLTYVEPLTQSIPPIMPAFDQHWFNPVERTMSVWSGQAWIEKIRVFACKITAAGKVSSMTQNADFTGTQVGLTSESVAAGEIMFDRSNMRPIKSGNYFVTTEDELAMSSFTSASIKLESSVLLAQSSANIPAFTVVHLHSFGKFVPATHTTLLKPALVGIVRQNVVTGDVVHITVVGTVSNVGWDWSEASPGALLYVGPTGTLITSPIVAGQPPVAIIADKSTVVFGNPQMERLQTVSTNKADENSYGAVKLNMPSTQPGEPIVVSSSDPRLEMVETHEQTIKDLLVRVAALEARIP